MNTFVFVLVAVAFVAISVCTAEDRAPRDNALVAIVEECQKSTKATDNDVKAFMARQQQTSKVGWCLVGCIKKKLGVITEKNQIDMDKLKENMATLKANNKELYEKTLNLFMECKKEVESDPKNMVDECTLAEVGGKCFYGKKAAAGIP